MPSFRHLEVTRSGRLDEGLTVSTGRIQALSKSKPEVPFDMFRRISSLARTGLSAMAAACVALTGPVAEAAPSSKGNLPIVRDAEIEQLVTEYAAPLLKAAGLSRSGIEIILVNSSDFNAFVSETAPDLATTRVYCVGVSN